MIHICIFFFKQKTAYEMRISDWSSDVCSSDLVGGQGKLQPSGVTRTLNGHDQGLRKTGETIDDAGLEIMRIAFLADHTKIHAGTKRPSFSTQDDTADLLGLLLQLPDMRIQRLKGLHIQTLQLFRERNSVL